MKYDLFTAIDHIRQAPCVSASETLGAERLDQMATMGVGPHRVVRNSVRVERSLEDIPGSPNKREVFRVTPHACWLFTADPAGGDVPRESLRIGAAIWKRVINPDTTEQLSSWEYLEEPVDQDGDSVS